MVPEPEAEPAEEEEEAKVLWNVGAGVEEVEETAEEASEVGVRLAN